MNIKKKSEKTSFKHNNLYIVYYKKYEDFLCHKQTLTQYMFSLLD